MLEAGRDYLLGVYLTNNDVGYTYGPSGGDMGWANQSGVVYTDGNALPFDDAVPYNPLIDGTTPDLAYHQRVAIEAGEDADGDGFGSFADCDDDNADVYPGHEEWCDGLDNDCDGDVDDDVVSETWLPDVDGDGFGDGDAPFEVCDGTTPPNGTKTGRDCDDLDAAVNPDAEEECDDIDNDCDGEVDEGLDAVAYWPDADGDGYGNPLQPAITGCGELTGFVRNDDDCNDLHAGVHPGAEEACDGIDNDCDGAPGPDEVDADVDGDLACYECYDNDPSVYIGAPEPCDGIDHDCDGVIPDPADCPSEAFAGEDIVLGSCDGCSTGGASPLGVGLLALALLRRRRMYAEA
jgi:MYXO-CTERM domain-containing protein